MNFLNFPQPFRINSFFIIVLCNFLQLFFFQTFAQNYPPDQNIHTIKWKSYNRPTNDPKYLIPFTDESTGNKVTRISDKDAFGCDCETLRHRYSKNQPWNADGSLIKTDGSYAKILDGKTFKVLRTANPKSLWSNIYPHVTYETIQNKFYKSDINTNRETVLRVFSEFSTVSLGYGEGNISNDDRWVALIGVNGKDQTVIVYDIKNNEIVGRKFIGTARLDWASVSQSGEFVVIRYDESGSGRHQGAKSYNRKMENEIHLLNTARHADLGYDMAGNEVYVSVGRYDGYALTYTRLDNGLTKGLWRSAWRPDDRGVAGHHVSTRNLKRPGWAYVSTDQRAGDPVVYDAPKEIFAIRLDDSETIERFAKHHTKYDVSRSSYNHESHPVPNRDGTKVIFASNWHNSQWMSNRYPYMFVVEASGSSNKVAVEDIEITPESSYLPLNKTLQLDVIFEPKNATNKNGTWRSSNPKIATVDDKGLVTPVSTGEVEITFKSADGGIQEESEIIVTKEAIKVNAGKDQEICEGSSTFLIASGGSTYLWSNGLRAASIEVSPNATVTYTVTAYDSKGKSLGKDDVTVKVNSRPKISAGRDVTIKAGESVNLTGSGAKYFNWSTGEKKATITVRPSATTTYSLTGKNDEDCEGTDSVKVTVITNFSGLSAGDDQTIYLGESTHLTATGGSSYRWNNGRTTAIMKVTPTTSRTYTVTGYDNAGKSLGKAQVSVTVIPQVRKNNVSAGENQTITLGESTHFTATGGSSYRWNNGRTTATVKVTPTTSRTYTVTAYDETGKSSGQAQVSITVLPQAFRSNVSASTNESEHLTAKGDSTVQMTSTASKPHVFTGFDQSVESSGRSKVSETLHNRSQSMTPSSIDYSECDDFNISIIASDRNSENYSMHAISAVNDKNLTLNNSEILIDEGQFVILTANGADKYLWSNGEQTHSITVSPKLTTSYKVIGSNENCESETSITINVQEKMITNAGDDVDICLGEKTVLTANGSATNEYLWSTGENTRSITVGPTVDTQYSVIGSNGMNSESDKVMVFVNNCAENKETQITNNPEVFEFSLYPNPTFGQLHIRILGMKESIYIQLYDLSGKTLFREEIRKIDEAGYVRQLDLSAYPAGMYILQLLHDQKVITKKVLLK